MFEIGALTQQNLTKFAFLFANEFLGKEMPVVLCVGNSRVVSDCLGPIVGELLQKQNNLNCPVYGNLGFNITMKNLKLVEGLIRETYPNRSILLVDCALGSFDDVGKIKMKKGGCIPGGGLGNSMKVFGDYSVLGYVNTTGIESLMFLKSCKMADVLKMAKFISSGIAQGVEIINKLSHENKVAN